MSIYLIKSLYIFLLLVFCSTVFVYAEEGEIQFQDGSVYSGELVNGEMTGLGYLVYPKDAASNSQITYRGEFLNGEFNGHGLLTYDNGAIYEGAFVRGLRHGAGKIIYTDGTEYELSLIHI